MKETRLIMGMPITVELVDSFAKPINIQKVFDYFTYIDNKFSTYKSASEISQINAGILKKKDFSEDMKTVFLLSEQTKKETNGYFNIEHKGKYDPSGLVKGWAIYQAYNMLCKDGLKNFFIEAGGDVQVSGKNGQGKQWTIGIRNPFNSEQIVKVIALDNKGVATSGTYIRGQHIYDPYHKDTILKEIVSLTVVGPNIFEADRFATAAFAMGSKGILFIQSIPGFDAYMINKDGIATYTKNFTKYTM